MNWNFVHNIAITFKIEFGLHQCNVNKLCSFWTLTFCVFWEQCCLSKSTETLYKISQYHHTNLITLRLNEAKVCQVLSKSRMQLIPFKELQIIFKFRRLPFSFVLDLNRKLYMYFHHMVEKVPFSDHNSESQQNTDRLCPIVSFSKWMIAINLVHYPFLTIFFVLLFYFLVSFHTDSLSLVNLLSYWLNSAFFSHYSCKAAQVLI